MTLSIRQATSADADTVWTLLEPVIRQGETYALPRDTVSYTHLTLPTKA